MFHVVLFALLTVRISAKNSTEEDNVLILNTSNFDNVITKNEFILVKFYVSTCVHCKKIYPHYSKAATQLKELGSPIKIGKVDAAAEPQLAEKFAIRDYPEFKFFKSGVANDYTGGHTTQDFVNWLKKKSDVAVRDLKDKEAVNQFKEESDIVLVGFFKDKESEDAKQFWEISEKFDDIFFGITSDDDAFDHHDIKKDGVVLFKKFDEGRNDFHGEINEKSITDFIHENQLPSVIELKQDAYKKIFSSPLKKHVVIFLKKDGNDEIIKDFGEVAKEFKGQYLFLYVDTADELSIKFLGFFNLKEDSPPSLRLVTFIDEMKRYNPSIEGVDKAAVRKLIQDYVDEKLERCLLSEDIPEGWDAKPFKTLVGKTFKEVVYNKNTATFVIFVSPWCNRCQYLVPLMEDLANAYKDNENIVLAQIDSTANELENNDISFFPTFKYYPRGSDQIIDYNGEESYEAFKKFIDSEGKEITYPQQEVETGEMEDVQEKKKDVEEGKADVAEKKEDVKAKEEL